MGMMKSRELQPSHSFKRQLVGNILFGTLFTIAVMLLGLIVTPKTLRLVPTAIAFEIKSQSIGSRLVSKSSALKSTASPILRNLSTTDTSKEVLDPLIVCGPSGVGKGTIIERFMSNKGGNEKFGFTVSHTTRAPREGEVDGKHYHFVSSVDQMKRMIQNGDFLEYAEVHNNIYGTSWQALRNVQSMSSGSLKKRALLDIDVQGVQRIKQIQMEQERREKEEESTWILKPKYVFIAPPNFETLQSRLIGRGTESEETLRRRTANARAELEYGLAKGNFDAIIINDDLDKAVDEFCDIVQRMYEP